jgi:hypothetical protein
MRTGPPPRQQQIVTIVMMLVLLVSIVVMRRQCAQGTAKLFTAVAPATDGGAGDGAR